LREKVTIVFGPAYKAVPICVSTAIALRRSFDVNSHYSFNRKEPKQHGEGGWVVGRVPASEDKIVIVDDVITDGTTKIETIQRLRDSFDAEILGLLVALDRKEKRPDGGSASRELERATGIKVRSIVTIYDIVDYLASGRPTNGKDDHRISVEKYLRQHGEP
jgi:orotate phosphoribosyltransferase